MVNVVNVPAVDAQAVAQADDVRESRQPRHPLFVITADDVRDDLAGVRTDPIRVVEEAVPLVVIAHVDLLEVAMQEQSAASDADPIAELREVELLQRGAVAEQVTAFPLMPPFKASVSLEQSA